MRVLIVEDDRELAAILRRAFEEQLWSVEISHDGEDGRHRALGEQFDLVVLDIMLPKLDGLSICAQMRSRGSLTPVILLTARDAVADRILGLDSGADDYVIKPFSVSELFARVRALLRRAGERSSARLQVGDVTLDPMADHAMRGTRKVPLTAREFALLQYFLENPGKVLCRSLILERVWDSNYDGLSNVVDVYVNALRNKLEAEGEPRVIATVRGRGYVLEAPEA